MTWEEVTAVGTLALAAVTAGLAWTTRHLAKAATTEARANWQPILIPEIDDDFADGRPGASIVANVLTIVVRNVGRGPALATTTALWDDDEEPVRTDRVYRGIAASDVVPPDERLPFDFRNFEAPSPRRSSAQRHGRPCVGASPTATSATSDTKPRSSSASESTAR
jgi:hypothetical protein